MITRLDIPVQGKGLYDITSSVARAVRDSRIEEGLCTLFIQHTSASLLIQENYDPAVLHDLERWLDRLVPEGDPLYTHTAEGTDDMPAHIKSALTATSVAVPVMGGRLALGSWQGILLWEHRRFRGRRSILVHL